MCLCTRAHMCIRVSALNRTERFSPRKGPQNWRRHVKGRSFTFTEQFEFLTIPMYFYIAYIFQIHKCTFFPQGKEGNTEKGRHTHLSSWCNGKSDRAPGAVGMGWVGAGGPGRGQTHHSRTGTGTPSWMRQRELEAHCWKDCDWRLLFVLLCSWEPQDILYWKREDGK